MDVCGENHCRCGELQMPSLLHTLFCYDFRQNKLYFQLDPNVEENDINLGNSCDRINGASSPIQLRLFPRRGVSSA